MVSRGSSSSSSSFPPADKIDFVRDVTAYILVVALVVGVAYDGDVC